MGEKGREREKEEKGTSINRHKRGGVRQEREREKRKGRDIYRQNRWGIRQERERERERERRERDEIYIGRIEGE